MVPLSYMRSVVDRNVVTRSVIVLDTTLHMYQYQQTRVISRMNFAANK